MILGNHTDDCPECGQSLDHEEINLALEAAGEELGFRTAFGECFPCPHCGASLRCRAAFFFHVEVQANGEDEDGEDENLDD